MSDKIFDEAQLRRVLSLLSKEELIDIIVKFMDVDLRTPNTLFNSVKKALAEVNRATQGILDRIENI